jgi:hypothetical protein
MPCFVLKKMMMRIRLLLLRYTMQPPPKHVPDCNLQPTIEIWKIQQHVREHGCTRQMQCFAAGLKACTGIILGKMGILTLVKILQPLIHGCLEYQATSSSYYILGRYSKEEITGISSSLANSVSTSNLKLLTIAGAFFMAYRFRRDQFNINDGYDSFPVDHYYILPSTPCFEQDADLVNDDDSNVSTMNDDNDGGNHTSDDEGMSMIDDQAAPLSLDTAPFSMDTPEVKGDNQMNALLASPLDAFPPAKRLRFD